LYNDLLTSFRKTFFITKFGYQDGFYYIKNYGYWTSVFIFVIPVLIGVLSIFGIFTFWKKYLIYFYPFFTYMCFFFVLGEEYRRMIFVQPYLIFFAILYLNLLYNKYKSKTLLPKQFNS
jgi:hypothetical protein